MLTLLLAAGLVARAQPALDAVSPAAIAAHVRFLSDDLLEGRYSGSRGHAVAERYVIDQLSSLGVQPAGAGGGWLQQVALRQVATGGSTFAIDGAALDDVIIAGDGGSGRDVEGPLVFAGHGLDGDIPSDLHGKIAVVLSGAPESLPSTQRAIASSNAAKLARLAKAGARAEIVLTTEELDKRRPWAAAKRNYRNGETFAADALPPMPVVLASLRDSARIKDAKSARLHLVQQVRAYDSANVIGLLPGASPETIVYSAHLDHHGICEPKAPDPICNGAIDNATGIAELLEIAHGFTKLANRERSVLFIAVTAEELGLHGSAWFTRHPTVPKEQLIADLNLDQLLPAGPVRELVLRGAELSTLEDHVRAAAGELGIAIGPDPVPEQNFYARSDQFNFAKIGVPAACLWQGFGGDPKYEAAFKDFRAHRYHQPSDEWLSSYDWEAAAQMARAELLVGVSLMTGPRPRWK
ncbi:MAG: M28 family peptidase [Myxococcales bacterium]|nr:M28 family peptidase [Myxococcales bacterium]